MIYLRLLLLAGALLHLTNTSMFAAASLDPITPKSARESVIVIMSAYAPELEAVEKVVIPKGAPEILHEVNGAKIREVTIGGRKTLFLLSGISTVNAAMMTQALIDRWDVACVLFAGIAGGIDPALHPGDVVIPAKWYYHAQAGYFNQKADGTYEFAEFFKQKYPEHFGMMFPDYVYAIRPGMENAEKQPFFEVDPQLLKLAELAMKDPPEIHLAGRENTVMVGGNGISGPVFLDNREYREFCFRLWQAKCGDMESTAMGHVAWVNRVPFLVVRCLSDLAGGQKGVNTEEKFVDNASMHAALVLNSVLRQICQSGFGLKEKATADH